MTPAKHAVATDVAVAAVCDRRTLISLRRNAAVTDRRYKEGVALVITLLMLSVITFMTVAFLALSRRDRAAVGTSVNQTDARTMSDAALARAQSEIIAQMMANNDILSFDLTVSKNFINPAGFDPAIVGVNTNNVNYDHDLTGAPLSGNNLIQNIANLYFDPRPPVYVKVNSSTNLDFRFWLDYNRNQLFETNGYLPVMSDTGLPYGTNGIPSATAPWITNFFVGEPEWIGVTRNPEHPHSPTNQFMGRYCFLVQPIGKTLDLNFIHNYSKQLRQPAMTTNCFLRNQGFGSWELNLAALLRDLNTNAWDPPSPNNYFYETNLFKPCTGYAFEDANSFLRYRYNGNIGNLSSLTNLYPNNVFTMDGMDGYSDGPLDILGLGLNVPNPGLEDKVDLPWPGADNPNTFYDMQEVFDPNKTGNFAAHLASVVNQTNNFPPDSTNRYTFSSLLASIGTESAVEQVQVHDDNGNLVFRPKVNLNYTNDSTGRITANNPRNDGAPRDGLKFFTEASELLLRSQFNFGVTNIPVYTNGTFSYTPAVHRLLQLAANIYDATTNGLTLDGVSFPSVFKPIFSNAVVTVSNLQVTNIYIAGYTNVNDQGEVLLKPFRDINDPTNIALLQPDDNIYGVPLVIGVKKGLPNFNECNLASAVTIERKLIFVKTTVAGKATDTNQMYLFGITNSFGVELWNSYTNTPATKSAFPRSLRVFATNQLQVMFTNESWPAAKWPSNFYSFGTDFPVLKETWKGWTNTGIPKTNNPNPAFKVILRTNIAFLPSGSEVYEVKQKITNSPNNTFDPNVKFPIHKWVLITTNRLVYALIDQGTGRLLDFVNLSSVGSAVNLAGDFGGALDVNKALGNNDGNSGGIPTDTASTDTANSLVWNTNGATFALTSPGSVGVTNQILIGLGYFKTDWVAKNNEDTFAKNWIAGTNDGRLTIGCPFQPNVTVVQNFSWQANDPLVHYTIGDLNWPQSNSEGRIGPVQNSLGDKNPRYSPWPRAGAEPDNDPLQRNILVKDPYITRSDNWNFPTNEFPNIGWLGRVHRGTPWQTVYLKSENPDVGQRDAEQKLWKKEWSTTLDNYPTTDWKFLDLFTVAPNENAAHGLLSVNQANLAPWSAVLSGVIALSNAVTPVVLNPVDVPVIVNEINALRQTKTNAGQHQLFHSIGDILEATNLTRGSSVFNGADLQNDTNLTDTAFEAIPQRILSLLQLGQPRFVIYAYGQSLKPKDLATGSGQPAGTFNLCTNYQITGEFVTRTVCHVENTSTNKTVIPKIVIDNYNILPGE